MSGVYDTPLAPLDDAHKFFIANVDFHQTAPQVKAFFNQLGLVNHVKLIPAHSDGPGGGRSPTHKGYGFVFMMDHAGALAVERYVNAFPNNKIEMMGRKDVFVQRHDERRRGKSFATKSSNAGRGRSGRGNGGGGFAGNRGGNFGPARGHGGQQYAAASPAGYPQDRGGPQGYPSQQGGVGVGVGVGVANSAAQPPAIPYVANAAAANNGNVVAAGYAASVAMQAGFSQQPPPQPQPQDAAPQTSYPPQPQQPQPQAQAANSPLVTTAVTTTPNYAVQAQGTGGTQEGFINATPDVAPQSLPTPANAPVATAPVANAPIANATPQQVPQVSNGEYADPANYAQQQLPQQQNAQPQYAQQQQPLVIQNQQPPPPIQQATIPFAYGGATTPSNVNLLQANMNNPQAAMGQQSIPQYQSSNVGVPGPPPGRGNMGYQRGPTPGPPAAYAGIPPPPGGGRGGGGKWHQHGRGGGGRGFGGRGQGRGAGRGGRGRGRGHHRPY